jgi:hypothetical protein
VTESVGIILFHGGPCDGQRKAFDETQAGAGLTSCGGVVYHVYQVTQDTLLALLPGAQPPHEYQPAAQPKSASLPHDPVEAWDTFWRGIGRKVPESIGRARRLRRRIRSLGVR